MIPQSFEHYLGEAADAQNRGICQICGREQAVRDKGNVTHHGYTVEYGWFQGTCPGQKHPPLQVDKSETEKQIKLIEHEIPEIEDRVAKLKAGKLHPLKINVAKGFRAEKNPEWVDWKDALEWQQKEAQTKAIYAEEKHLRSGVATVKMLKELIEKFHGKDLKKVEKVAKKKIEVGSTVKVAGKVVVVKKIANARVHGVSPSLNGQFLDHVYWETADGKMRGYPMRNARLVE